MKFDAAKEAADRTARDSVQNAEKKRLLNRFFQRKNIKMPTGLPELEKQQEVPEEQQRLPVSRT